MLSIFTSTMFFHSTSNDRLKPVMTTGLVNMNIDWSIANLGHIAFRITMFHYIFVLHE